jgi:hypothetical protein
VNTKLNRTIVRPLGKNKQPNAPNQNQGQSSQQGANVVPAGQMQQQAQPGMGAGQMNAGQSVVVSSVNAPQGMQPTGIPHETHVITVGQNVNQAPIIINQVQMANQGNPNAANMGQQATQMQMQQNSQAMQANQMMQQRVQMPQNRSKFNALQWKEILSSFVIC